ncbi:hypothetical protein FHETE_1438 [Fusarium heterosporum]|uniref:Ankyrin repeat protein n=1 Tax=Fusarium heterosporum TaxID=42747 RepID=A0A8H5TWF3_FUSHE|nr:hypothetical protein FHETE_1438 [Fusarium heterosporum]
MSTAPDNSVPTRRPAEFFDKFPNEILKLFAETMVESSNSRSLANFVLAYKPGKQLLEEVLYTKDIRRGTFDGFTVVMTHSDQDAARALSKYPVNLIRLHVNKQLTRGLPVGVATYTMLHGAAARGMHATIWKLHRLGAQYLNTPNFRPMMGQAFQVLLQACKDRSVISSEFTSLLHRLKWKPGFAVFIQNDITTFNLLTRLWNASEVGTWEYRPTVNVSGPSMFPMTLHHLAVFGDNSAAAEITSLKWSQYARVRYPHNVEASAGETKCSVLHLALKANNRPVLEYLIERCIGFQAHFVDNQGNNPLHTLLKLGMQVDSQPARAEWKKLQKVFFKASAHLRWNPIMPQTQYPFQTPLHMAMANIQDEGWAASKFMCQWIVDFVLEGEDHLKKVFGLPPGSIVLNHPDAEGYTPLSRLCKAAHDREEQPSAGVFNLIHRFMREGTVINLDTNRLFTPRVYAHSSAYLVKRNNIRRKHLALTIFCGGGRSHHAEVTGNYPNLPPTDLSNIVHTHVLRPNHPMTLPAPFSSPLLPPDQAHADHEKAIWIMDLHTRAHMAIIAPYMVAAQASASSTGQNEAQA